MRVTRGRTVVCGLKACDAVSEEGAAGINSSEEVAS